MGRVNYANTNELWKQMLGIQTQKMMADLSLERQLEYLERSNALSGERESARIQQSGAKEKEVALYKHGLSMAELAKKNAYWMAQQPGVKRLMNMYQTTDDPNVRTQIEASLDKFSTIFGTMAEKSMRGEAPGADEMGAISTFIDPKEAITYFNGISANVRGKRTADIQERGVAARERGVAVQEQRAAEGGGKKANDNDLNATLAARAAEAMTYLTKGGEGEKKLNDFFEGGAGADELGKLRRQVSKIKSMAGQGKFKDESLASQYFDFIDAIYESPEEALRMSEMLRGTVKGDALEKQTKSNLVSSQARKIYIAALIKNGVPQADAEAMADKRFPLQ